MPTCQRSVNGSVAARHRHRTHEIGVALDGAYPRPLTDEVVRAADVVITMGCGDACPIYPGRTYLDWDLADPVGLPLEGVRAIRDDVDTRFRALLVDLGIIAT
ncbi:hypothetical protein E3O44_06770 [Cryobacterium algoricola]|uniref:Phosphotyrosine protein phosphatase I domain-containing protein n=1 Tax=Cryobacterium algoricola TaxID=1259183 RepID=A0ABY2IE21_9MICO|nr:hypothetical protein [Cryobacterium algoricola]TFB86864.1 hypothetical protein E3O44_06770 [Cryobacterium algoricola]